MIFIDFPTFCGLHKLKVSLPDWLTWAATAPVDTRAGTRRLAEAFIQKRTAEREASKPMISRDWQIIAYYSKLFFGQIIANFCNWQSNMANPAGCATCCGQLFWRVDFKGTSRKNQLLGIFKKENCWFFPCKKIFKTWPILDTISATTYILLWLLRST